MAISAYCDWEVRDDGSDTNGGGYDPSVSGAGTDYSQQAAAQLALTDVVANGTTTLTSATGGFTAAMVGNAIYLQGGSGALAATWRMVTGYTNGNTITVDATVAAGTGITGNLGGALATVAQAANTGHSPACPAVAGNTVYVNYRTGTAHTWGEAINLGRGGDSTTGRLFAVIGYDGTAGTRNRYSRPTNRPTLKRTVAATMISAIANGTVLNGFVWDLDGGNYSVCNTTSFAGMMNYSKVVNSGSSTTVFASFWFNGLRYFEVEVNIASGSTSRAFDQTICDFCRVNILGTTGVGFYKSATTSCLVKGAGTGGSSVGFHYNGSLFGGTNCLAYNVATGFSGMNTFNPTSLINSLAHTCAVGFSGSATAGSFAFFCRGCAGYNCTSLTSNLSQTAQYAGDGTGNTPIITLSADPCVDAAGGDFTLNNAAGGGAVCRGGGWYPIAGTASVGYSDIGPLQVEATGSTGGGGYIF